MTQRFSLTFAHQVRQFIGNPVGGAFNVFVGQSECDGWEGDFLHCLCKLVESPCWLNRTA